MTAGIVVTAPFAGWLSPLAETPDPVFADGMMGDGAALDPLEGVVRAPCDAEIIGVAPTGHSVTLRLANGAELLIHVGIDTVELRGTGFSAKVTAGQRVAAGDALLAFDLDSVAAGATSLVTPIVVVNAGFRLEHRPSGRRVVAGEPLFAVIADGWSASADAVAPAAADGGTGIATRQVVIGLEHGIHARPAARLAAALKPFVADVVIEAGGHRANARSTVALLALGTAGGDVVTVRAEGADAEAAIAAVARLIAGDEDNADHQTPMPAPIAGGGVCASPGIAVGPIAQFRPATADVPRHGTGPVIELERLQNARHTAIAGLGKGGIADAHRALLADPELIVIAEAGIDAGRSAGWAWRDATEQHAAILRGTGNPRLIERIDDLNDIAGQVLAQLGHVAAPRTIPAGSIMVAAELLPSQFVALNAGRRIAGIWLAGGGPTSHVAVLAAAAGVPMVVAAGPAMLAAAEGHMAILDASAVRLDTAPDADALAAAASRVAARVDRQHRRLAAAASDCHTADGVRVEVFANLASTTEAAQAVAAGAEGCGLLRTEFVFLDRATPPGIDEQRAAYQAIADALEGRPLIVRTLDVGGDKPVPYLPMPPEDNPALGARGIRMGLARPELLAEQLAAILAVTPVGRCRIMVPMIVDTEELRQVRAMLDAARAKAGITATIELGVMIETPAAALLAEQLAAEADFLSIGTNDLTQYTLAADRGNPVTAAMIDALHPAVLRLIAQAVAGAQVHGRPLGVCGAAAGDPAAAAILIGLGVTELSVAPALVPGIKALVASLRSDQCRDLALAALACPSAAAVRALAAMRIGDQLREAM